MLQQIPQFASKEELLGDIDNGGRFYNLFSKAKDNVVSEGELAKAAGVYSAGTNAFLFLAMAMKNLPAADRHAVLSALTPSLRHSFESSKPKECNIETVEAQGKAGEALILETNLAKVEDKSNFTGFIYTPIMVGEITTFTMTPIFDHFILYKAYPIIGAADEVFTYVTTPLNHKLDSTQNLRIGGYLRELEFKETSQSDRKFYLEATYVSPISDTIHS